MPFVAFLLGISSGFPLTLLLATMTFWLSRVGIDKSTIGFAIGLTTPYTLKFLWAPLVDKVPLPAAHPPVRPAPRLAVLRAGAAVRRALAVGRQRSGA